MTELPLAAAQRRLRRPGRPRKSLGLTMVAEAPEAGPEAPLTGTQRAQRPPRTPMNGRCGDGTRAPQAPAPAARLLDLRGTATYLGLAPWTVRELEWRGVLRRIRVPLPGGGELRKVLFDRADLDHLVERWKDPKGAQEGT
jgi:hypothetical protein